MDDKAAAEAPKQQTKKLAVQLNKLSTFVPMLAALLSSALAHAAPGDAVATVTHLSGVLTAQRADGSVKLLSQQSQVMDGDLLSTQDGAYARLKFADDSEVVIRPESVFKVVEFTYRESDPKADQAHFELSRGGFRSVTGKLGHRSHGTVNFETPRGSIKPLGTNLGALFCNNDCGGVPTPTGKTPDNGLHVDVAAGAIVVTPKLVLTIPTTGSPSGTVPVAGASVPTVPAPGNAPAPATPGNVPALVPTAPPVMSASPAATILNAGQFGYLPPPQNGVTPPLVLVPPSQAVQVRMPPAISQNNPAMGATSKTSAPECIVR